MIRHKMAQSGFMFLIVSLVLTGCASSTSDTSKRNETENIERLAGQAFAQGNYEQARTYWQNGIDQLGVESDSYYANMLYRDHYRQLSNIAWSNLIQGELEKAKIEYDEVFSELVEAEKEHARLTNRKDSDIQLAAIMVGLIGATTSTLTNNDQLMRQYNEVKPLVDSITTRDTSDTVPSILNIDTIEADGVRFIVMPSLAPLNNIGRLFIVQLPLPCGLF